MENAKKFVLKNQDRIVFTFYAGAGIAAFNCLTRPDFNLFVYLYCIYIWTILEDRETRDKEKINSFFFILFTFIIDIIWVLYWGSKWGKISHDYERTIHGLVLFVSWIAIFLKVGIIFAVGLIEWSTIHSSLPDKLKEKLTQNEQFVKHKDEIDP